jgi:hypothetical protein
MKEELRWLNEKRKLKRLSRSMLRNRKILLIKGKPLEMKRRKEAKKMLLQAQM